MLNDARFVGRRSEVRTCNRRLAGTPPTTLAIELCPLTVTCWSSPRGNPTPQPIVWRGARRSRTRLHASVFPSSLGIVCFHALCQCLLRIQRRSRASGRHSGAARAPPLGRMSRNAMVIRVERLGAYAHNTDRQASSTHTTSSRTAPASWCRRRGTVGVEHGAAIPGVSMIQPLRFDRWGVDRAWVRFVSSSSCVGLHRHRSDYARDIDYLCAVSKTILFKHRQAVSVAQLHCGTWPSPQMQYCKRTHRAHV